MLAETTQTISAICLYEKEEQDSLAQYIAMSRAERCELTSIKKRKYANSMLFYLNKYNDKIKQINFDNELAVSKRTMGGRKMMPLHDSVKVISTKEYSLLRVRKHGMIRFSKTGWSYGRI